MTGQEILKEVRHLLNDPRYSRYTEINRAYRRICRETSFNWLRVTSEDALKIKANITTYRINMSGMRVLQRIWVKEPSNEQRWVLLEEAPPQFFEEKVSSNRNADATDNTKRPDFYKLEGGQNATITFTPTPDQAYTTRVDFIRHFETIGREESPAIPNAYHDTVAMLAAGMILQTRGNPQEDFAVGGQYIADAMGQVANLVRDSHPNRTIDFDRTQQDWLR